MREIDIPGQLGNNPSKFLVLKRTNSQPKPSSMHEQVIMAINAVVDAKQQGEPHEQALINLTILLSKKGAPLPLNGNGYNGSEKE